VILTHAAMIATGRAYTDFEKLTAEEEMLAYLPLAWVGQNMFSYSQSMVAGFCVSCPESAETVMTDLREIGPTYYFAPPRVLEALLTQSRYAWRTRAGRSAPCTGASWQSRTASAAGF